MLKIDDIKGDEYKISGIYQIKNIINGKSYIGQSQNLDLRFKEYRRGIYMKRLETSVKYHGVDNFEVIILEKNIPLEKLTSREQYWMDYYKSYDRNFGYNIAPFAQSCRGIKRSPETIKKMSEAMKRRSRELHPLYGKKHSDETKKRISETRKNMNIKLSPEHKKKISDASVTACNVKVKQIDMNTYEIIKIWDSISDAERETGINGKGISRCINSRNHTAGGFIWRHIDDNDIMKPIKYNYKKRNVLQYDLEGNFIKEYESLTDAANSIGVSVSLITSVCSNKEQTAKGFQFRYSDDDREIIKIKPLKKRVCKIKDGTILDVYESIVIAGKLNGVDAASISRVCRGIQKTSVGYFWEYYDVDKRGEFILKEAI